MSTIDQRRAAVMAMTPGQFRRAIQRRAWRLPDDTFAAPGSGAADGASGNSRHAARSRSDAAAMSNAEFAAAVRRRAWRDGTTD